MRSVCLLYIFLLQFSNKMKSSFLFYGGTKQFNHRIVKIDRAFIYLFKNLVSIDMNLSISSPQKAADNT